MITFVPTPIGNLKDITLRALETLRAADCIFCEDTRNTVRLLSAYEIKKPLFACHKFNEREAAAKMVALSREGKEIAVVSDAGMPAISDPGAVVCKILKEENEPYTVLPGACAFVCAVVLSAFSAPFTFLGFLPEKNTARERLLARYKFARETLVFHCAPHDVDDYVHTMSEVLGNRRACAVREISKLHEECREFFLADGYDGERRGEFVLLVEGAKEDAPSLLSPEEQVQLYIGQGMEKKEALKKVAAERGIPKSELYKQMLDL